jgi:hypothetical protein
MSADLFDGELHELVPGVDWQEINTEGMEPSAQRSCAVAGGWSVVAIQLQAISRAIGGKPNCYQKGKRYFFQHQNLEEE